MSNLMRVCAEINLDAVCHNVAQVQKKVGGEVKVMVVVKTNGYGHGAVPLAEALARRNHVYGFAVATAAEGVELRRHGITQPILVLGYSFEDQYHAIVEYNLTQTVFQLETARVLSDLAALKGKKAAVHIKVDTGMGRIGFRPVEQSVELVKEICSLPGLSVEGVFTHFACADEADKTSANQQEEKFVAFLKMLEQAGVQIPLQHVCNSAAIIDFDDRYFNLVRSGIMTYGLYPSEEVCKNAVALIPALALKSHVAFVKTIQAGESVSYGSDYTAEEERVIATIPVGYGDGYPRRLSGKGRVLIHGQPAPIIGRICMDQFMVDVSGIPGVRQNDPVVLVGEMGENVISVEELAELAGSFHYEFICNINQRVPRVYLEAGKEPKVVDLLEENS